MTIETPQISKKFSTADQHSYQLHMYDSYAGSIQELSLSRAEFIRCMRLVGQLRGFDEPAELKEKFSEFKPELAN